MAILDAEIRRGFGYVRPFRGRLTVILGLNLVGTALALYVPFLTRGLVDDALLGQDRNALTRIVGLFAGVTVASFVLNFVSGIRYTEVSAEILFRMRLALYRHLQRLSPRFHARTPLGEIMSRLNNDVSEIQRVLADVALAWLGNAAFLAGSVAMLLWLDWRLFLAAATLLPPAIWALVRYRRRLEGEVRIMRERSAGIGAFLIETLRGVRLVVAANAAEREAARFRTHNDAFVRSLMRMQRLRYLSGGIPGLLLSASTAVIFLYGGARVIDGALTLGTFTAFMAYQMRLIGPVQGLMGLYTGLGVARVSLRRFHEFMDEPVEVVETTNPARLLPARGEIVFEDVWCGHGRGGDVLRGLALAVAPGEVVALTGPSGSGKSTVADLLVRHLDPDAGRILLDGIDLREMALADLRARVAVVDQAAFIFNASIAENVRYARPGAGSEKVTRALQRAGLGEFVAALPEGVDTVVGEDGRALSAGERQRLAIARALLADPAVLVLDEATSALDADREAKVVRAYSEAMAGRTTVLITHREELLRSADRVVRVDEGWTVAR